MELCSRFIHEIGYTCIKHLLTYFRLHYEYVLVIACICNPITHEENLLSMYIKVQDRKSIIINVYFDQRRQAKRVEN